MIKKSIIVYFSRNGQNYVHGTIRNLPVGNTEVTAEILRKLTGADMFKIEPVTAYSGDYSQCIEEAKADQRRNARPELKHYPKSMQEYRTIYLGYPNYWGTMPMPVLTFLEYFDFTGKTIMPFCTHEGSGMGKSEDDIKKCCPGAHVAAGLPIHGTDAENAEDALRQWIEREENP